MTLWESLVVAILSMTPVIELNGSVPIAVLSYGWSLYAALIWGALFNALAMPLVFWLLPILTRLAARSHPFVDQMVRGFYQSKIRQHSALFDRWGALALFIFMAVPGPFSGVWSATLLAWLFNIKRTYAYLAIILGVIVAAVIIGMVTLGGKTLISS